MNSAIFIALCIVARLDKRVSTYWRRERERKSEREQERARESERERERARESEREREKARESLQLQIQDQHMHVQILHGHSDN